jgi:CPA2 family monovalent cation:H+ antiporter-2
LWSEDTPLSKNEAYKKRAKSLEKELEDAMLAQLDSDPEERA